jgi:glycosidase
MLNLYRALIHLRKKHKALSEGEFIPEIKGFNKTLGYFRRSDDELFFIILNFSGKERLIHAGERGQWRVMFSTHRTAREHFTSLTLTLAPYEATVLMRNRGTVEPQPQAGEKLNRPLSLTLPPRRREGIYSH